MVIDFAGMTEEEKPHFKGGEKSLMAKMYTDELTKIMRGRLAPGASIGMHTHDDSSEMIFILSGTASILCDGEAEEVTAGSCHYCPKGHTHTMRNRGSEDLVFFAVVPEQ